MLEKLLAAILDLTAALQANTAALNGAKSAAPGTPAKGKSKSEEAPAAESSTPAASTPSAAPAASAGSKSDEISIEDLLKTAQQILDKGGLEKIKAINAKLGFKKISQCPPEKLSELKKSLDEVIKEMDVT